MNPQFLQTSRRAPMVFISMMSFPCNVGNGRFLSWTNPNHSTNNRFVHLDRVRGIIWLNLTLSTHEEDRRVSEVRLQRRERKPVGRHERHVGWPYLQVRRLRLFGNLVHKTTSTTTQRSPWTDYSLAVDHDWLHDVDGRVMPHLESILMDVISGS